MHWYYWLLVSLSIALVILAPLLYFFVFKRPPKHKYKAVATKYGPRCLLDDVNGVTNNSDCAKFTKSGNTCTMSINGVHTDGTCSGTVTSKNYSCNGFDCVEDSSSSNFLNDPTCSGTCVVQSIRVTQVNQGEAQILPTDSQIVPMSRIVSGNSVNELDTYYFITKHVDYTTGWINNSPTTTVYRNKIVYNPTTNQFTVSNDSQFAISSRTVSKACFGNFGATVLFNTDRHTTTVGSNQMIMSAEYADSKWSHKQVVGNDSVTRSQVIGVPYNKPSGVVQVSGAFRDIDHTIQYGVPETERVLHAHVKRIRQQDIVFYTNSNGDHIMMTTTKKHVNPFDFPPTKKGSTMTIDVTNDGFNWLVVQSDEVFYYELADKTEVDPNKWSYKAKGKWQYSGGNIIAGCISEDKNVIALEEESGPMIIGIIDQTAGKFLKETRTIDWKYPTVSADGLFLTPTSVNQEYLLMSLTGHFVTGTVLTISI